MCRVHLIMPLVSLMLLAACSQQHQVSQLPTNTVVALLPSDTPSPTASPSETATQAASATLTATATITRKAGKAPTAPPHTATPAATSAASPTASHNVETLVPPVDAFEVSPAVADPGGTVTVTWKTTADKVNLFFEPGDSMAIELGQWLNLPAEGSQQVTIPADQRIKVSFVLVPITGSSYVTGSMALRWVTLRCPDAWFFPNGPDVNTLCPTHMVHWSGAAEYFEHGFMLWLPAGSLSGYPLIHVFYDGGAWQWFGDTWQDGVPESDPALTPPNGLFQPVRGFGLVWRNESGVRDQLGWATGREFSYDGITQWPFAFYHEYPPLFEQTPSGVLEIFDTIGTWKKW